MKKWVYAIILFVVLFFLPVFSPVSFASSDVDIFNFIDINNYTFDSEKSYGIDNSWYILLSSPGASGTSRVMYFSNQPFGGQTSQEYLVFNNGRRAYLYNSSGEGYKYLMYYLNGNSVMQASGFTGYNGITGQSKFFTNTGRAITDFWGYSYSSNYDFMYTNIPIFSDKSKLDNFILNGSFDVSDVLNSSLLDYPSVPVNPSDLGYIDQVQYYVDSYAYHNDQANTPEWVKWGSKSTTGIDLSDSRYYVEFMMEDKSTFLRNGANDSWLSQSGVPFASAVAYAESKLEYATSYLFPSGSDQRALLQGKAAKTSLYGKASGLGSVPASAGVFKFSCTTQYQAALNNDSSSDKGLFYNVVSDILSNQGNIAEKFFNNYQSSGKALNFTYDLFARIVDNTSGSAGNWLKIDRHNSPFEWSNNDRFLNGGVTASRGHRFVNFNPETNVFKSLPEDDPVDDDDNPLPDGDPALPVPVGTGYVDNSDNSVQNIYNNYNYTYNTFYDNDLFYVDSGGKSKDTASGLIETIGLLGLLGILWTWYLALFGDLLPLWAVVLVPVFGAMFVAFLVWKFGKGLIR